MAKIIFASWMIRYPLGGVLSWALQYLLGLKDLGHDVYFVEKAGYNLSCFDPIKQIMTNDCQYGIKVVSELFNRFGFKDKWCYVDYEGNYYGLNKEKIKEIFKNSDLFIDCGSHDSWSEESSSSRLKVLIDGEPGYTQIKWANNIKLGIPVPKYDRYFTVGTNIGNPENPIPTLNLKWEHVYDPVKTSIFKVKPSNKNAPYSTFMNWQSHRDVHYNNKKYGQKDIEFKKFVTLPKIVKHPIGVAVAGKNVPYELLKKNNWIIHNPHEKTITFDTFCNYLSGCRGEFSVCKNVFVENRTGFFSDKSAAFLASGRPVIVQDTGFSSHLPVGEGLFAVNSVNEAKESIMLIEADYDKHSRKAREIACEYFEAEKVMESFLGKLGL